MALSCSSRPNNLLDFFVSLLLVGVFILSHVLASSANLSFSFYSLSCPGAEFAVRNAVSSATAEDPTVPGKLLRLLFHDCFVEGCDASVLIEGNRTERSDPANASLGGFSVIENAKAVLEMFCPATVSCSDIVALAARDAVAATGGPKFEIPTGRRDGKVSAAANVRSNIIDTDFTLDQMIHIFSSKGLSLEDLVVLSGAHTIGVAHCSAFNDRFKKGPKGDLELIDASLDNSYASTLMKKCSSDSATVNNDPETAFAFDNQYYKNLQSHKGLFQTDSALLQDNRTRKFVEDLATDQESFFEKWSESFVRLSMVGVKSGEDGEIRRSCSAVNG